MLGVIELQMQQGTSDTLSPRLREAAMEAVAAETGKRQLTEALPNQRHRRWGLIALTVSAAAAAVLTITPRAGINALERWILPLSDTERYTFTKLEKPPTFLAVAFGEAFEIDLKLADNSEQRPEMASGRFGLQPPLASALTAGSYRFSFPGQQDPGIVRFSVGDLRHEIRIEPVQRPAVESVSGTVISPDYLQIPPRIEDVAGGFVSAVEGSRIVFSLTTNRPLVNATYGPTSAMTTDVTPARDGFVAENGPLLLRARTSTTAELGVGALSFEVPFQWRDQYGLTGLPGYRLKVEAMKDAAPVCYLQGIDRQLVMLPEETVDFEVLTEDDFGVRSLGLEWSGEFTRPTDDVPAKGELKLAGGGPEARRVIDAASFSPVAFDIAPQKVSLRGYVEDSLPGRGRVYSESVTLFVLTRDEHAQMLKTKFDRSITELEDLARREQDLLDENQRLERLDGEELQSPETAKRLEAQEEAEAESKRRMQELTTRMEELMKDSARNETIEKETLKKMAEALKSMQELSKTDLPKVEEKLNDSQDQANTREKSASDLAEAVREQQKAVEKMQAAIAKASDANQQFEAGTFINRLKKASGEQAGIATSLVSSYERLLGVKNSKLDPSDQRRLKTTIRQQADTASDVRWIQEDLGNYFARTKSETFNTILEEMKSTRVDSGLEEVRSLLGVNHAFLATEKSQGWADKLAEWAKLLEAEKNKNAGGGGDGGGPSPEDEDFEFMLRVMRLIQQEQDIRSQTRALEQLRRASTTDSPKEPEP